LWRGFVDVSKLIHPSPSPVRQDPATSAVATKSDLPLGIFDKSGKFVIQPSYDEAYEFRGGYAQVVGNGVVTEGKQFTEIDKNGGLHLRRLGKPLNRVPKREQILPKPSRLSSKPALKSFQLPIDQHKQGFIFGPYGFIDGKGRIVVPARFDFVSQFHEGLCAVLLDERWSYIDEHGKEIIKLPEDASGCGDFSDGMARVAMGGRGASYSARTGAKWGFIDRKGRFVIKPRYEVVDLTDPPTFVDGLAKVCVEEYRLRKFGFIDQSGKFVIKPIFNGARNFSEGLAAVSTGPWTFVPEEWKRHPEDRFDMADKFFRSYPVVGMSLNQLHQLLGAPEEYRLERFGKTKDPCESYVLGYSRCNACWINFQNKNGKVARYSYGSSRAGRTTRWTDDGSTPSPVICPNHHYCDFIHLDENDSAYCGKCNIQF
jgi:hypothetical protein